MLAEQNRLIEGRHEAEVFFDEQDNLFIGRLLHPQHVAVFESDSVEGLRQALCDIAEVLTVPPDMTQALLLTPVLNRQLQHRAKAAGVPLETWARSVWQQDAAVPKWRQGIGNNFVFLSLQTLLYVSMLLVHESVTGTPDGQLAGFSPMLDAEVPQILELIFFLCCGLLLILRNRCRQPQEASPRTIIVAACWIGLLACLTPTGNSSDPFDYLESGRILAVLHKSPYYHNYDGVHDEYSEWAYDSKPILYGPVTFPIMYMAGLASTVHLPSRWLDNQAFISKYPQHSWFLKQFWLVAGLYTFKVCWLFLHLLSILILLRTLPAHPLYRQRLLLYAVNPVLLYELVVTGHNDMQIVFFVCLWLYGLRRRQPVWSTLAALAATLTKVTSVPLLLGVMVYSWHRRDYRNLALTVVLSLLTVLALRLFVFDSFADFGIIVPNETMDVGTSPCLGACFYPPTATPIHPVEAALTPYYWYALRPTLALLCLLTWWRARSVAELAYAQLLTWSSLLVVCTVWLEPWYFSWLVPLGLVSSAGVFESTLLLSFTALIAAYDQGFDYGILAGFCLLAVFMVSAPQRPGAHPGRGTRRAVLTLLLVSGWGILAELDRTLFSFLGLEAAPYIYFLCTPTFALQGRIDRWRQRSGLKNLPHGDGKAPAAIKAGV